MTTRIYAVEGPQGFHLVEAGTKVGALRHVAEKHFTVSVANQKTLVAAMKDGVQIETAGADESQATS
jgi:hypothetical protein